MPLRWASCLFRPAKGPATTIELNKSACPAELQEQLTSRGTACLRPRGAHVIYERFDDAGQGAFTPPVFIYIKRLPVCGGLEVCVKRTLVTHFVGRAAREARLQVQLHHPHLLPALASVRGRHHYYLVLPAADGDLWAEAEAMQQRGTGYDEFELREVARQILLGLEHLHASGLAHRDIKPANVLRLPDGRVAVADFGCADGCTTGFVAAGTTQYQPPECRRNTNAQLAVLPKGYDQRFQDMWSVGATLASLWFATLPEIIRGSGDSRIPTAAAAAAAVADAAAAAAAADGGDAHGSGSPASVVGEPASGGGGGDHTGPLPAAPSLPRFLAVAGFAECKSTVGACGAPMSDSFLDLLSRLLRLRPSERLTASQALQHEWLAAAAAGGGGGALEAEAVRPVVLEESASAPVVASLSLSQSPTLWDRTDNDSRFVPFASHQQLMFDRTRTKSSTAQGEVDGPECADGPEQGRDRAHCQPRRHPEQPQQQPQQHCSFSPAGCSSSSRSSSASTNPATPSPSRQTPSPQPQPPAPRACPGGSSGSGSSCAKGLLRSSSSSPAGPGGHCLNREDSSSAASYTSRSPGEEAQQLALREQQQQSPSSASWLLRPSPSPQASNPKRAQRAILRVFVGAGGESSGSN
ncbi:hypothetical protein PLESTB_001719600 [Pleodorina starrii]|uniref:non-specific serine/threonine protein kinase n=1 Tax=Pleodorina starrii TaxID=330485 RepID=A0A9W6C0Y4_9CHLO|nr:hypothetical protein PLESTB_001719600 [Pleodorina starrii]